MLDAQLFLQPQIAANNEHGLSTSIINMVTDVWRTDVRALNIGTYLFLVVICFKIVHY